MSVSPVILSDPTPSPLATLAEGLGTIGSTFLQERIQKEKLAEQARGSKQLISILGPQLGMSQEEASALGDAFSALPAQQQDIMVKRFSDLLGLPFEQAIKTGPADMSKAIPDVSPQQISEATGIPISVLEVMSPQKQQEAISRATTEGIQTREQARAEAAQLSKEDRKEIASTLKEGQEAADKITRLEGLRESLKGITSADRIVSATAKKLPFVKLLQSKNAAEVERGVTELLETGGIPVRNEREFEFFKSKLPDIMKSKEGNDAIIDLAIAREEEKQAKADALRDLRKEGRLDADFQFELDERLREKQAQTEVAQRRFNAVVAGEDVAAEEETTVVEETPEATAVAQFNETVQEVAPAPQGRTLVYDAEGNAFHVPNEQVDDALAQGFSTEPRRKFRSISG